MWATKYACESWLHIEGHATDSNPLLLIPEVIIDPKNHLIANTVRLLWFGSAKAELNGISCENNTGLSLVDYQLLRPTLPHLNVFPWFLRLIGLLRCSRTIQLLASHLFHLLANYWPQKSSSSCNNPYLLEMLRIFSAQHVLSRLVESQFWFSQYYRYRPKLQVPKCPEMVITYAVYHCQLDRMP